MELLTTETPVYVETGTKRVFVGAIDWPGWSRCARDERTALATFHAYGPRYAAVLAKGGLALDPPAGLDQLAVVERLQGDGGTNFGIPSIMPSSDGRPMGDEHDRLVSVLRASWLAFEGAAAAAEGKELLTGPRGGGREPEAMTRHVVEANWAYLGRVVFWPYKIHSESPIDQLRRQLGEALEVLARAAAGDHPTVGRRGGVPWPPRYFVRRMAWHVLDHAWELEDRAII